MKKDLRSFYQAWAVAVGGPPHSGKSVFLAELYRQILARRPQNFVYLQRMCPDGEGVYSSESDPQLVKDIRRKGKFAAGFLDRHLPLMVGAAMMGTFKLVLADLGGVRSAENAEILAHSTHLITLSSDSGQTLPWIEFAEAEGCKPLSRFASGLVKMPDGSIPQQLRSIINIDQNSVTGLLLQLDRDAGSDPYKEAIGQYADWLIAQVEGR